MLKILHLLWLLFAVVIVALVWTNPWDLDTQLVLFVILLVALIVTHRYSNWLRRGWRCYRASLPIVLPFLSIIILAIGYWEYAPKEQAKAGPSPAANSSPKTNDVSPSSTSEKAEAQEAETPLPWNGPVRISNAISLLKLGIDQTREPSGMVGRTLAILLWIIAGVELQRLLIYRLLNAGQMRRSARHTVICGLGDIGIQIYRDLKEDGEHKIIVIDANEQNSMLDEVREDGGLVLIGDATEKRVLNDAGVRRAKQIFAVAGDDLVNCGIVTGTGELLDEKRASSRFQAWRTKRRFKDSLPLQCFAHIEKQELAEIANRYDIKSTNTDLDIHFVSPLESSARYLLQKLVLNYLPEKLENRVPHFVIVGLQKRGQAIALEIAKLFHIENKLRSRLTLVANQQSEIDNFQQRYPTLAPDLTEWQTTYSDHEGFSLPAEADDFNDFTFAAVDHSRLPEVAPPGLSFVCNAGFRQLDLKGNLEPLIEGIQFLATQPSSAADTSSAEHSRISLPIVILCSDDDVTNAAILQRLQESLQRIPVDKSQTSWGDKPMPLFCSIADSPELIKMIKTAESANGSAIGLKKQLAVYIEGFAPTKEILGLRQTANSGTRGLAKLLNADYEKKDLKELTYKRFNDLDALHKQAKIDKTWFGVKPAWYFTQKTYAKHCADRLYWFEVNEAWRQANYWQQQSNLLAAAHAPFQGRIMGLRKADSKFLPNEVLCDDESMLKHEGKETSEDPEKQNANQSDEFTTDRVCEHNRYSAERLLDGWRYAPSSIETKKDDHEKNRINDEMRARKERPSLVPTDHLPDEEREKVGNQLGAMVKAFGGSQNGADTPSPRTKLEWCLSKIAWIRFVLSIDF